MEKLKKDPNVIQKLNEVEMFVYLITEMQTKWVEIGLQINDNVSALNVHLYSYFDLTVLPSRPYFGLGISCTGLYCHHTAKSHVFESRLLSSLSRNMTFNKHSFKRSDKLAMCNKSLQLTRPCQKF